MASTAGFPSAEAFGERVRRRRIELGLSQKALGALAGMDRTYVGSIEKGKRNLPLRNILRLAKALEVDPGELVRELQP